MSKKKQITYPVFDNEEWLAAFIKRVKHLRESRFGPERGSKSAAARAIGVTPSDWSGYEKGVIPGADKIHRMCVAFDCDANWLLDVPADTEKQLNDSQDKIVNTLIDVQEALHAFDGMFTDCLVNLREVLTDPEIAQAQCFKLYAIAHRLTRLRKEVTREKKPKK